MLRKETFQECIARHADSIHAQGRPVRSWDVAMRSGFEMWVVRPVLAELKAAGRYA